MYFVVHSHGLFCIQTVLLIFIGNEHGNRCRNFMGKYGCWRSGRFVFCSDLNAAVDRHLIRGCSVAAGTIQQQFGPYSVRNLTVDLLQPLEQFGFKVLRPFGAPFVEEFYPALKQAHRFILSGVQLGHPINNTINVHRCATLARQVGHQVRNEIFALEIGPLIEPLQYVAQLSVHRQIVCSVRCHLDDHQQEQRPGRCCTTNDSSWLCTGLTLR
uniref:Putative secreted protein n=1 Tax=Anopheles darlingi TaxID=43151 RepID=A0A2M4D0H7_ANODA